MRRSSNRNEKRALAPWVSALLFVVILLVVWQVVALAVNANYIMPSPAEVAVRAIELIPTPDFWLAVGITALRVFVGFAVGMVLGIGLALLMSAMPRVLQVFSPFIKLLRTTPVVCFILLMLLWIRADNLPVIISALAVLPIAWTNTLEGLKSVDGRYLELAQAFELSGGARLRKILLPAIWPQLASAAGVGMGIAWKSGVTAEVLSLPLWGMGTGIYHAKIGLAAADVFVWTIVIVLISIGIEHALRALARKAQGE